MSRLDGDDSTADDAGAQGIKTLLQGVGGGGEGLQEAVSGDVSIYGLTVLGE